jgi:NAD(P)-dependent dehydrogenase (short-subunit alcohol dehydrogenase family)
MNDATWPRIRFDYRGIHVLVTGGTAGIGLAVASAYRAAGAEVTITGTRGGPADYDEDLSGCRYLKMDITDKADIAATAAAVPRLDILVNNGGIALAGLGKNEYEPDNFDHAINMMLTGVYRLSHACREKLTRSELPGGASIVGMGSMSSFFGIEVVPAYGSAKTGLLGMTRALAVAWGKHNIRVNTVAPGLIKSRQTSRTLSMPEAVAPTIKRTPLGRIGTGEEVAGAVLFLTSPAASFITGQVLAICGGYSIAG